METVTTRYNWLNAMDENAIRKAAAKFIPAKYFDEYFTPESAPAEHLRSMLEDVIFENNLTPEDIDMNTTTTESKNANTVTEFSELSHAGQCLDLYLMNTESIYNAYTVPAIETAKDWANNPYTNYIDAVQFCKIAVINDAIQAAARLVRKYAHLTPTAADIEAVTACYVAYVIDCAKYELQNA